MSVSCARVGVGTADETTILGTVRRGNVPAQRAYIRVTYANGDFASEVRCTPSGDFHLALLPGRWSLVCLAPRARLEQPLSIARGDQYEVNFQLEVPA